MGQNAVACLIATFSMHEKKIYTKIKTMTPNSLRPTNFNDCEAQFRYFLLLNLVLHRDDVKKKTTALNQEDFLFETNIRFHTIPQKKKKRKLSMPSKYILNF